MFAQIIPHLYVYLECLSYIDVEWFLNNWCMPYTVCTACKSDDDYSTMTLLLQSVSISIKSNLIIWSRQGDVCNMYTLHSNSLGKHVQSNISVAISTHWHHNIDNMIFYVVIKWNFHFDKMVISFKHFILPFICILEVNTDCQFCFLTIYTFWFSQKTVG